MTDLRPRRAPLWFVVLVVVVCAAVLHVSGPTSSASDGVGNPAAPITFAVFGWIVLLVEAIWKGVEVAGRISLVILQYSVSIAWRAITLLGKGAAELAGYAWKGAKLTWELLRRTYDHVLKPAWRFFWKWVDRVEEWLQRTFGPVLSWLRRVRAWILDFWSTYIRPVLDLVDITRRALRVLSALGVEWAQTLDRKLGELEDRIQGPFLKLLGKVNEIINLVNRVVTLDGLFQKLAFVRTFARDVKDAVNQIGWGLHRPLKGAELDELHAALERRSLSVVERDIAEYIRTGGGPDAAMLNAVKQQVRVLLGAPF